MIAVAPCSAVSVPSPYECWYRHFLQNRDGPCTLPWHDAYRLSAAERRLVARSIQQFQLGEWARGRGLVRRASSHSVFAADSQFLPALELFIAEEQGHSNILGQFLDREGIPRLRSHWLDRIFRRLRKLAGLEVCATVLVNLNYQALTLGLIRRPLSAIARVIRSLLHSILFRCTAALLWQQHHRLFRVAGWDSRRFWKEARRLFARLQLQIGQASQHPGRSNLSGELRLD